MQSIYKQFVLSLLAISLSLFTHGSWSGSNQAQKQNTNTLEIAIFAGGCFWCMEPPFDKLEGVVSTTSGYTGGRLENPTYEQVSADDTGHYEAVQVTYDPTKIDYATLLNVFWHNVDPLDTAGQFCDKGNSYRTAIFYLNDEQKILGEQSKKELDASAYFKQPVVTELIEAKTFYPAENYHQNYYQVNPLRYKYYRFACGRDKRLNELWGDSARIGGPLVPALEPVQ